MGVTICLPLFGHPGRELDEGTALTGRQLRDLAKDFGERLERAAVILDTLTTAGWKAQTAMFDALLWHPSVITSADAEARLRSLGVNPDDLIIVEDPQEEDE